MACVLALFEGALAPFTPVLHSLHVHALSTPAQYTSSRRVNPKQHHLGFNTAPFTLTTHLSSHYSTARSHPSRPFYTPCPFYNPPPPPPPPPPRTDNASVLALFECALFAPFTPVPSTPIRTILSHNPIFTLKTPPRLNPSMSFSCQAPNRRPDSAADSSRACSRFSTRRHRARSHPTTRGSCRYRSTLCVKCE